MGTTGATRAMTAAAALTAAAVLLAGCGAIDGAWSTGGGTEPPPTPRPRPRPSGPPPSRPAPRRPPPRPPPDADPPTPSQTPATSPTPKPTATKKPRTTLVRGDSGPKVLALQQRLKALGYWLGAPDGKFGSLTQQAVWAFQKSAGLRRDGVVGPKTLKALAAGIRPEGHAQRRRRRDRPRPADPARRARRRGAHHPQHLDRQRRGVHLDLGQPRHRHHAARQLHRLPRRRRHGHQLAGPAAGGRASSTAASRCTAPGTSLRGPTRTAAHGSATPPST